MGLLTPLIVIRIEMKKLFLISGFILIVLNTLIGFVISKYSTFNYLMVDINILISTVLIYLFSNSNISDGYKIGISIIFIVTGFFKIIFSILSPYYFQDNFFIIVVIGLTSFEVLCLFSAFAMKKFT